MVCFFRQFLQEDTHNVALNCSYETDTNRYGLLSYLCTAGLPHPTLDLSGTRDLPIQYLTSSWTEYKGSFRLVKNHPVRAINMHMKFLGKWYYLVDKPIYKPIFTIGLVPFLGLTLTKKVLFHKRRKKDGETTWQTLI